MFNKILKICGIVFIVLVIFGLILVFLMYLGGARQRVSGPGVVSPLNVFSPLKIGLPEEEIGLPDEKGVGEITSETPSRLVIKTGTINMVVKDIKDSAEKIIKYAEEKGGWVVSSSITEREKVPSGSIIVRVPAESFDVAMNFFKGLAVRVTYEGTQGQDVTEEYVDLQSRLRNLEATETQLLKIMERSGKISEVLEVQRELTRTREEIERIKGRMQYLEQNAKMATITINLALSEELLPIPPAEKWRPKYVLFQAWRSVISALRNISYLVIRILVYGIIWVPLVVIILGIRKFLRKKKVRE